MYDPTPEPGRHRANVPASTELPSSYVPRHARWRSVSDAVVPELVAGARLSMPSGLRPRGLDVIEVPL